MLPPSHPAPLSTAEDGNAECSTLRYARSLELTRTDDYSPRRAYAATIARMYRPRALARRCRAGGRRAGRTLQHSTAQLHRLAHDAYWHDQLLLEALERGGEPQPWPAAAVTCTGESSTVS